MSSFALNIITPEKLFYSGEAEHLIMKEPDGELGILPGHVPMVIAIDISTIRIKIGGEWKSAALAGGFAQIKNNEVNVFVDSAEWPEDIEVARATEAKKRAEERIIAHKSDIEYIRSQVALKRSLARLDTVKSKKADYH